MKLEQATVVAEMGHRSDLLALLYDSVLLPLKWFFIILCS